MKKLVFFILIISVCLTGTSAFAFSISDNSENGVKIGIFEDLNIDKSAPGSVLTVFGNATIKEKVNGDVIVILGNATIDAEVNGSVISVLGTARLTDNAKIHGDLVSIGEAEKSEKSDVLGYYQAIDIGDFNLDTSKKGIFIIIRAAMLMAFILSVIILVIPVMLIFKKRLQVITDDIELRLGRKVSIGLPGFIICFLTLILLSITGLVPIIYFLYAVLVEIVASIFIGKIIMNLFNSHWNMNILFIIGFIILVALKTLFIFLIYINGIAAGAAVSFGFDMLVNTIGTGILIETQFGKKSFI